MQLGQQDTVQERLKGGGQLWQGENEHVTVGQATQEETDENGRETSYRRTKVEVIREESNR